MIGAVALLGVLAAIQDAPPVVAVVREVPGDGASGVRPRIVCEGTADLPEGSRLELRIYYGPFEPGKDLQYRSVQVRNGAFSRDFFIFPDKNLAGSYTLKIAFNPAQPSPRVRPWSQILRFRIGTPREGEEDRIRVLEGLARDIRAIVALADDLQKVRGCGPERSRQAWRIAERAWTSPEYKAVRVEDVSGAGLLDLCNRLAKIAAVDREAFRDARAGFDRAAQKHLNRLAAEQIGNDVLGGCVEEMRGKLSGALRLSGDSLEKSRKEFTADLLGLQAMAPARHHAALAGLASGAVTLFDESCSKGERETRFRQDVEPQILRLLEEFRRSRWE